MTDKLRQQSEQIVKANEARVASALSPEEIQFRLHELEVRQIELEMQNEELRRTQGELETIRARYFDLYDLAPVGYVTLSNRGLILEANLSVANLLGVARSSLIIQPLSRFLFQEDLSIYYLHRKQLIESGEPQSCELRMRTEGKGLFWPKLSVPGTAKVSRGKAWVLQHEKTPIRTRV